MGQVKQFGMWLAECVYSQQMSETQIVSAANSRWSVDDQTNGQWLLEQIEAVRCNPQIYGSHSSPKNAMKSKDSQMEAQNDRP